jgi:hypothetical protein
MLNETLAPPILDVISDGVRDLDPLEGFSATIAVDPRGRSTRLLVRRARIATRTIAIFPTSRNVVPKN